jgi:hypothetical protein
LDDALARASRALDGLVGPGHARDTALLLSALLATLKALKALRAGWSGPAAALGALGFGRDASSGLAALRDLSRTLGALDFGGAGLTPALARLAPGLARLAALRILILGRIGETDGRQRQTDRGAGREQEAIETHVGSLFSCAPEARDCSNSRLGRLGSA